jgi:CRP-like cAMP-binding protein
LLSALAPADFELLRKHLRLVVLAPQSLVFDAGERVGTVHFPHNAAISLAIVLSGGQAIETAMTGRDGVLGAFAAIDGQPATCRAVVQIGGNASAIEAELLRQAAQERESIRTLLVRHETALSAHTQQLAACNASHALETRFARWLLRARDACGAMTLPTTQEIIAEMMGVRRTSISLIAHAMQQQGLIRTRRGQIEILNITALQDCACECYGRTAVQYERLGMVRLDLSDVQIA